MKNQVTKNFSIVIDFTINANGETIATINNQAVKNDLLPEQTETKPAPKNKKLDDIIKNCPLIKENENTSLSFGEKFKNFRLSRGYSQGYFAKLLNVDITYLQRAEWGKISNPVRLKKRLIKRYSKQTLSKYFTFLG